MRDSRAPVLKSSLRWTLATPVTISMPTVRSDRESRRRDLFADDMGSRELGPKTGVPVIFLTHLAAVLDNWDPRVVDGIAAKHLVITFDNRGVGASTGSTPDKIQAMAKDAITFIRALGLDEVDLLAFLHGRHDRPGDRAGRTAARPQADPRGHRSCRRRGHREGDRDLESRRHTSTAHLSGPETVPLLHQDSQWASSRQGVHGTLEGAHREPGQGDIPQVLSCPAQGHPPLGPGASFRPLDHWPARARRERRERQDGADDELRRPGSTPGGQ